MCLNVAVLWSSSVILATTQLMRMERFLTYSLIPTLPQNTAPLAETVPAEREELFMQMKG